MVCDCHAWMGHPEMGMIWGQPLLALGSCSCSLGLLGCRTSPSLPEEPELPPPAGDSTCRSAPPPWAGEVCVCWCARELGFGRLHRSCWVLPAGLGRKAGHPDLLYCRLSGHSLHFPGAAGIHPDFPLCSFGSSVIPSALCVPRRLFAVFFSVSFPSILTERGQRRRNKEPVWPFLYY